jgi:ubiquinone/menaquinone biosynthesis C-methylase UbiE
VSAQDKSGDKSGDRSGDEPTDRQAERQARLAEIYDDEIWPAYAARFAALAARALELRPGLRAVEVGCATGHLTRTLAERLGTAGHLTALDGSPAFVAKARARIEADNAAHSPVALLARPGIPRALPLDDQAAERVISNLTIAAAADPAAAVAEAARVLAPAGQLVVTAPLRGTWSEFFDLFRDVLREGRKHVSLGALDRHIAALPDGPTVAAWLTRAGLTRIAISVERWEILFKSAREFFFAPLIELGPLAGWKELSGQGDEMQDVFFFTKEAIDVYFKGRPFAVTVVAAVVSGWKPQ